MALWEPSLANLSYALLAKPHLCACVFRAPLSGLLIEKPGKPFGVSVGHRHFAKRYADASDAFFQRAKSEMALVQYNQMLADLGELATMA